jgi:hypothetical protein
MASADASHGEVRFGHEDQVRLFAQDMAAHYGASIIRDLAAGRDQALARDIPDPQERVAIARAIISAALNHETMGLSLNETRRAERSLAKKSRELDRDPRTRDRDRDHEH